MERQIYPISKIKVGAVLYTAIAYEWKGKINLDVNEWVVRSIQKKRGSQTKYGRTVSEFARNDDVYVNITEKVQGITWGKRSKKNGDYGWLASISQQHRQSFKVGERLPYGVYTTKLAALKYALKSELESVKWYENELSNPCDSQDVAEYTEELDEAKRLVKVIKSRITKERNKTP